MGAASLENIKYGCGLSNGRSNEPSSNYYNQPIRHISHSQMSFSPSMLFAVVGTGQCTKVLMECAGQDSRIRGLYSEGVREREGINISGFIFTILSIPLGHHGEMLHLLSP